MGFSIKGFANSILYSIHESSLGKLGHFKSFVLLSNNLPFVYIYERQSFPLMVPETLILEQNLTQKSDL